MCDKARGQAAAESKKVNTTVNKLSSTGINHIRLNKASSDCYERDNDLGEGTSGGGSSSGGCESSFDIDSFKRFGDDLVEVILEYLPFSDKVTLESVCKQWRRVIYNRQTILHLNRSDVEEHHTLNGLLQPIKVVDYATGFAHYAAFKAINKTQFKSMLRKCKFIKTIDFECYCDGEDLELLGKHLKYLHTIECDAVGFNEKGLIRFGQQYGHRLKVVKFNNSTYGSRFIRKFLRYCPNIVEIYTEDHSAFINDDQHFVPKLQVIKSLDIRVEHLNQLKVLTDKYHSQLKIIKIFFYNLIGFQSRTALSYISTLENLEELELYIGLYDDDAQTLDENIMELAKNCAKLRHLDFTINNDSLMTSKLFYSFGKFRSIERLNLYFYDINKNIKKLEGSCECFKLCAKLKHLNLSYKETGDEFFHNINEYLPNLRSIDIDTEKELSDETMACLSRCRKLRTVFFRQNRIANKYMTDTGVCQLINSCTELASVSFNARPKITSKTVDAVIDAALKKPRIAIEFHCGFSNAGDEAQFDPIDLDSYADNLPVNLKLGIATGHNND